MDLDALRAAATKAAGDVRALKASGAAPTAVQAAVAAMQSLRAQLDAAVLAAGADADTGSKWKVNKKALDDTLARRMFVVPAFEIHGGVAGLFDYGPPGCSLKENVLSIWRQYFVLEDSMLQIECTTLTPYPVLKTSGHVDKFEDLMTKDVKTGECLRADKLLEDFIENALAVSCRVFPPACSLSAHQHCDGVVVPSSFYCNRARHPALPSLD
jgi:glycyl-tRNA synthetase